MALSLDTTYMRLPTCMALFKRWRGMEPAPRGEPDPYADMTLDEIKRSVIHNRLRAMRPGATYQEIADSLGITHKTLWVYRQELT